MLVDNHRAIVLVDLERAGLVVPAIAYIPPARSLSVAYSIGCRPTIEASVLVHLSNAILAMHINRAHIVVLHLPGEGSEIVVAYFELAPAPTKVRVLVESCCACTSAFFLWATLWLTSFRCTLSLETIQLIILDGLTVVRAGMVGTIVVIEATWIVVDVQEAICVVITVWLPIT
jgi:hypothetical protein